MREWTEARRQTSAESSSVSEDGIQRSLSSVGEPRSFMDRKWTRPNSRDACTQCTDKFTMWRRAHRCRNCGRSFCSNCSRHRVALRGQTHKSRVCDICFPHVLTGTAIPVNSFIHSRAWVPRGIFARMLSYLDHVDLCVVSMTCRWWYKRASLDLTWKPLYRNAFPTDDAADMDSAFHRDIHGVGFENLPWKQKFAIRWTSQKAAQQAAARKKSFKVMESLLASLGLQKYAPVFEREEIDIEALTMMNAGYLRDLGIPAGPRVKLLNMAACLVADMGQDDEEDELTQQDASPGPVTPAAKFTQRKKAMNLYRTSLVRRVQQSTVRIAVLTIDGQLLNVGSGIILHERGLIATAYHCLVSDQFNVLEDMSSFMVLIAPTESASEPPAWKYHARVLPHVSEAELDVALLWIEGEVWSDPPCGLYVGDVIERSITMNWTVRPLDDGFDWRHLKLPALPIGNSNNVEPGDELWMFGYPSSGHNTITVHHAICSGTDSQLYKGVEVPKALLRSAALLDNGFSGGAAVDKKGQLVGVISFSLSRQDRVRSISMIKSAIELAKSERLSEDISDDDDED
ncbi:serine protease family S01B [Thraustotheca clavata]|uniref:Serine protease family S01B n=1 Tax=Thraustotheca clavata TaxID=74557 RepID=A0A1V9Y7R2_9STRA|nr:serine protease family S01B [Thraustotheca clavata]